MLGAREIEVIMRVRDCVEMQAECVRIGSSAARETQRPLDGYTVPCTARLHCFWRKGGMRGRKGEKDGEGV